MQETLQAKKGAKGIVQLAASKWLSKMGWKLRKDRRLTASRSTGDLLKTVKINWEKCPLLQDDTALRGTGCGKGPKESGYLYVLAEGGFWFRMFVKVVERRLETFYEATDKAPVDVVHLNQGHLVIPRTIEAECPEDRLYPLHVVKEEHPVACFAAETALAQAQWAETIRNSLQTCSLDIEGLNLEYSSSASSSSLKSSSPDGQVDRSSLLSKLDLVEELLSQRDKCGELPKDKKTLELCQKMVDADNWYDRVIMSEQQEALRKATYLRQRKISTQLKADTIRKQLSKSTKSKNRRPKSLCEAPEEVEFYEGQLEELNKKLKNIHTSLGQTEMQAEVAYRKLGRKRESEMKRLHSDVDLHGASFKRSSEPYLTPKPTIWVSRSQDDCRLDRKHSKSCSFVRKGTTGSSPKSVRKYFSDGLKFSASVTSISEANKKSHSGSTVSPSSGNVSNTSSPTVKNRISPLRLLGNFVDSRLMRARNRVKKAEGNGQRQSESSSSLEETENWPRSPELDDGHYSGLAKDSLDQKTSSNEKLRTEIDPVALAELSLIHI